MNTLIRLVGEWIARRLESGNARAGVIGAVVGALIGVMAAYALLHADALAHFRYAAFIIFPLVIGFAGAATGAAMPVRETITPKTHPVRLNNLNRALVPAFCVVALGTLAVLAPMVKTKTPDDQQLTKYVAVGLAVGALIALVVFLRSVLWVDVYEDGVVVRRTLGPTQFGLDKITRWGFEVRRGSLSHDVPQSPVPFVLVLTDGFRFEVPSLSPRKGYEIVARLSHPAKV